MIVRNDLEFWIAAALVLLVLLFGERKQSGYARCDFGVSILVSLVMMVVSAVITNALTAKPKPPEPGKADIPEIEEGKAPVEIYGTVWIEESFLAAWKQLDPAEPIKIKAGKK